MLASLAKLLFSINVVFVINSEILFMLLRRHANNRLLTILISFLVLKSHFEELLRFRFVQTFKFVCLKNIYFLHWLVLFLAFIHR